MAERGPEEWGVGRGEVSTPFAKENSVSEFKT